MFETHTQPLARGEIKLDIATDLIAHTYFSLHPEQFREIILRAKLAVMKAAHEMRLCESLEAPINDLWDGTPVGDYLDSSWIRTDGERVYEN